MENGSRRWCFSNIDRQRQRLFVFWINSIYLSHFCYFFTLNLFSRCIWRSLSMIDWCIWCRVSNYSKSEIVCVCTFLRISCQGLFHYFTLKKEKKIYLYLRYICTIFVFIIEWLVYKRLILEWDQKLVPSDWSMTLLHIHSRI